MTNNDIEQRVDRQLEEKFFILEGNDNTYWADDWCTDVTEEVSEFKTFVLSLLTEAETRGRIDQMESIKPFFLRPSMYDLKRVYDDELSKLQEKL